MAAFEAQLVMTGEVRRLGRCCWPKHISAMHKSINHKHSTSVCVCTAHVMIEQQRHDKL